MAHEKLHVERFRSDVTSAFKTAQTAVEGVSVPASTAPTPEAAKSAFLTKFAVSSAFSGFERRYAQSVSDEQRHTGGGYTEAELQEMAPFRSMIANRLSSLDCD